LRIDLSWLFIAVLLTWSLAAAYFPHARPGLEEGTYLVMGVVGMLGLFASVVLHELGHALVARKYDLPIRGITLFIFGGVAEMTEEAKSAKAEFFVAIGGPVVSLVLALLFRGADAFLPLPGAVAGVVAYLGLINTVVLVFNLIPAFPLDGGRVLRAALWHFGKSMRRATRIASSIGSGFGWILIAMGVLQLLAGSLIGAIWWALLGMFLRGAATGTYQQLQLRRLLEGEPVRRFMKTDPVAVRDDLSLKDLVEDYVYRHHFKTFPVVDANQQLLGSVTTRQVRDIPREQWDEKTVREVMQEVNVENTLHPEDDAMRALSVMNQSGQSRYLVVEDGTLKGILSLKDLMEFFSLKVELEEA
jgi:Zn-dependent protease/CBS domain-containing protein